MFGSAWNHYYSHKQGKDTLLQWRDRTHAHVYESEKLNFKVIENEQCMNTVVRTINK